MKIAILSDIHGNYRALKAVIRECEKNNITKYFILGDLIGYYFDSFEVINCIQQLNAVIIKGNHEDMLLKALKNDSYLEQVSIKYGTAIKKIINSTYKKEISTWISQLPYEYSLTIDSTTIKIIHGNYNNWSEYLYPNSKVDLLDKYCDNHYDFVFCGHSHYNFVYKKGRCLLVNVGSIGMNKQIGGIACWVVLDTDTNSIITKSTPYDYLSLIDEIQAMDTPNKDYLVNVLLRNR